jgi:hypothetical protein
MQQYSVTQEQDFLLGRECALAAMSIGQGLTLIRKYDYVKHAYGTQAFFMLTIGIERLLKVIIIYNHRRLNNNSFPNNAELKSAGHKIDTLYKKAKQIADDIGKPELYKPIDDDPIFSLIIKFLTEFAHNARYYNLDSLTGHPNSTDEPLRAWNKKINKIIVERHYRHNKEKEEAIINLSNAVGSHFMVSFDNEDGNKVDNIKDFYLQGMTVDVKQKYSMFYIYCLVRFFSNLLWNLDKAFYPVVSEYFSKFRISDDAYVKSRKTWNPYEK